MTFFQKVKISLANTRIFCSLRIPNDNSKALLRIEISPSDKQLTMVDRCLYYHWFNGNHRQ